MFIGLIGKKLGHSFSKPIHELLSNYTYNLKELPTEKDFEQFMQSKNFEAINVTIPYKEDVIPYLAHITDRAKKIGAVNTITNKNNLLYGDNTDYAGFLYLVNRKNYSLKNKHILILGTGGTQKTARAVAIDEGASSVRLVSRSAKDDILSYEQALNCKETQVIINTTPVGMYPNNGVSPIDISGFDKLEAVFDVIYNPSLTPILYEAKKRGLVYSSGLSMLVAQAKYASEIFSDRKIDDVEIDNVLKTMQTDMANIVLIGMAGCGKSTIGKALAQKFNKKFVDVDEEIVKATNKSIAEIFEQEGEEGFRKIESEITANITKNSSQIIATGGGVITKEQNYLPLQQNGVILYIKRDINDVQIGNGRPLSSTRQAAQKLFEQREPVYQQLADVIVENNTELEQVLSNIENALDDYFDKI